MTKDEEKYQGLIRYNKIMIASVAIICVIITGYVFIQMKDIIIPLVLALIIYFLITPALNFSDKKNIPETITILVIVLVMVVFFYGIGHMVNQNVNSFSENIHHYEERLKTIVDDLREFLRFSRANPEATGDGAAKSPGISAIFKDISLRDTVSSILSSISEILSDFFIVILYLVFLLIGRRGLISKIELAFKSETSKRMKSIIHKINDQINKYILTKTLISLLTGTLVTVALWIFGVEFAFIWGFLTFLLNFIPNIGSIIATVFPIVFSVVQFDDFVIVIWIAVILLAIQFLIGNVVEPKVVGKSMGISPVVVLFSLIFWGYVWGIVGMVLAVPIAVVIKIILENISELKPLSVLMSDYKA
jgi:predicted PurR-regulated permease PerM